MQETGIQSLGQEDPLQKEMATHSSILAWEAPWTEEPGGLQSPKQPRVGAGRGDAFGPVLAMAKISDWSISVLYSRSVWLRGPLFLLVVSIPKVLFQFETAHKHLQLQPQICIT